MAYDNCSQHLEIFSEIRVMPVKLQFALQFTGITHTSEKISRCC